MGKYEEDTAAANKLFVEAVKLVKSAENAEGLEEKADALEKPSVSSIRLSMTVRLPIWQSS